MTESDYDTYIELVPLGELPAKVWYDYQPEEMEQPNPDKEGFGPGWPADAEINSMIIKLNGQDIDIWSSLTEKYQEMVHQEIVSL